MNRRGDRSGTAFLRGSALALVALLVGAGIVVLGTASPHVAGAAAQGIHAPASLPRFDASANRGLPLPAAYSKMPLIFEANLGQTDPQVKFVARGRGYGLFLTANEAVLALQGDATGSRAGGANPVVTMRLANANPAPLVLANDQLPGKSNYLIGNDPAKWHRNVPQFARVRYQSVYPGIDLVYYGKQGRLEYDFEVSPGADPKVVSLLLQDASQPGSPRLTLNDRGDLQVPTSGGDVRFTAPRVYQRIGTEEKSIPGRFTLRVDDSVGFELGNYDRTQPLIIDPVLSYATFLGGSGAESCSTITGAAFTPGCPAIAVDSASNTYIAGATTSTVNFPNPAGVAASNTVKGPADVFITKFDNTGANLLFTTYLGGSGTDTPAGIAVDSGFDIVVAGTTNSADFPHTAGAYQGTPASANNKHVFVTRFDPTGSSQLYSTYLSGNGIDIASGVALDLQGKIYVTGTTTSTDAPSANDEFPATVGAFQTSSAATTQFFLTKVDPSNSGSTSVPYSTYFGGSNPANGIATGGGIAVDSTGNVYITGGTNFLHVGISSDFPILNAVQGCLDTPQATAPTTAVNCSAAVSAVDAFVAKINPAAASGAQLQYSTYVGGTGNDVAYGIAVDAAGDAYITGSTTSTDFVLPATVPYQAGNAGGMDAFVAKLSSFTPPATTSTTPTAVSLVYFSYLGGANDDVGTAIATDSVGGARITGWTESANLPVQNAIQSAPGGGRDGFIANLDTTAGAACVPSPTVHCASYVSFFGGAGTDMGTGITVDSHGGSNVTGETGSPSIAAIPFVTAPPAPLQNALAGPSDAFVARLNPVVNLSLSARASPTPVGIGNQVVFTYTITNLGDVATGVTFTDNFATSSPNATFVSATASPGSCGTQVTGGSVQCNVGTLSTTTAGATAATVSITLTPTPATTTSPQVPPPTPTPLGNSGTVSVPGTTFQASATATATVNDFAISVAPATQTVAAGGFATYQVMITPTGPIPSTVNLTAASGLPTGTTTAFSTNPLPNLSNGPVSSVLNIGTTARVTTTVELRHSGAPFYAGWLPVSGLALLGVGMGGKRSRRRRWAMGLLFGGFFALILFQAGCGTKPVTTTTTGTPAGTYTVTISATSGTATRTTTVQLVVQ